MSIENSTERDRLPITLAQIQKIQKLAETICYGSINLIFQDGVLVQIDRSEKIRLNDHKA